MRGTPGAQSRAAATPHAAATTTLDVTLLELVTAVAEETSDEREIVATVMYMLRSGRARLTGNFRDEPLDSF